jgi:phospholipid/cholesterol/gamma-HCH transport system permease protein
VIAKVGALTLSFLKELSSLIWMGRETAAELMERVLSRKAPFRLADFFFQTHRVGVGSVFLVALVSVFVGLTMALLTGYQLERFGLVELVPITVAITFAREMGPLLTGIVLAARIGAAYTAELGTMVASEEVEAIEGMGIGPLRYLVTPRFFAIFFMAPCLSVISLVTGILGGAFISSLLLGLNFAFFYDQTMDSLLVKDVVSGAVKSFLFGGIIGWIACFKGMAVRGGAAGVGSATTSSVVTAITMVIGCDTLCNIFLVTVFK